MDCNTFVLSIRTQYSFDDSRNLENSFDFSSLNENQELFLNKREKIGGDLKLLKTIG